MAAFERLDWSRFDVSALVHGRGLATIDLLAAHRCTDWLAREGYRIVELDFARGIGEVVVRLGELFHWTAQFGYALEPQSRNLDALRDGFGFEPEEGGDRVLALRSFAAAWREDERWSRGFLEIAGEFSLEQLALGKRFFTLLVVSDDASELIGQPIERRAVPPTWRGYFR